MLRYFIFIEYGLLPDLRVGVLISASQKGQEIHLTSTEYKLLLYLMENRGRVVTKAMLLEQLWDIDGNFVDDNTVRVNIKRLRQKLNDEKQEYIVTVFGMGYSFGE